jgi:hypothetical protein
MTEDPKPDDFDFLCRQIGLALMTWQDVEIAHFRIFFKLVGAPTFEIASIVYHHTESFEGRHNMVLRLIEHSLKKEDELRKLWEDGKVGLYKNVKDANLNRNKLAHYSYDFMISSVEEMDNGEVVVTFGDPRLQPSPYNMISRLLGRTPDKEAHNLSAATIQTYISDFVKLARRLNEFWEKLPHPVSNPNLQQALGPPPKHLLRRRLTRLPINLGNTGDDNSADD